MSEKPLLLSPAKSGVLVGKSTNFPYMRYAATAVGIFVVCVGLADVSTRIANATFGDQALFAAFAPPAALGTSLASSSAPLVETAKSPFTPTKLSIPSLGVRANVEPVGVRADGAMGIPEDYMNVSWYALGGKPGGEGSVVFAGHVNNSLTKAGIFAHLSQIDLGDYITVSGAEGKAVVYKVTDIAEYPADEAPAAEIFKTDGSPKLVLITCEGDWVPEERTFDKRLVVTATPAYRE